MFALVALWRGGNREPLLPASEVNGVVLFGEKKLAIYVALNDVQRDLLAGKVAGLQLAAHRWVSALVLWLFPSRLKPHPVLAQTPKDCACPCQPVVRRNCSQLTLFGFTCRLHSRSRSLR